MNPSSQPFFRVSLLLNLLIIVLLVCSSCDYCKKDRPYTIEKGNVIFIHPDGTSLAGWTALRSIDAGPDSQINWDRMEKAGLYRGNVFDALVSTSNAGATIHAYGVKVPRNSFGSFGPDKPLTALSGQQASIMEEARDAGYSVALINSGHICEPGTAVFLSDAQNRGMTDEITLDLIESDAEILFSGGEVYLLPEGVMGVHGHEGVRKDGLNLIEKARELGYSVIFTREALQQLPVETEKVLGVFASWHTFNDKTEEEGMNKGIPLYDPEAPTDAEMLEVALKILTAKEKPFLLILEEEGTDNFANHCNATGTIEALRRADQAIGTAMDYSDQHGDTLVITAADSDAGGMAIMSSQPGDWLYFKPGEPIPFTESKFGSPIDGVAGAGTPPFISAPDKNGNTHTFAISWANNEDIASGVIARASGLNAELMPVDFDNTDVYRMMYATLFGVMPGEE